MMQSPDLQPRDKNASLLWDLHFVLRVSLCGIPLLIFPFSDQWCATLLVIGLKFATVQKAFSHWKMNRSLFHINNAAFFKPMFFSLSAVVWGRFLTCTLVQHQAEKCKGSGAKSTHINCVSPEINFQFILITVFSVSLET